MLNAADWEARYREGNTPWDKGEGSPGLVDFLERHPELPRGRVLVPGCGVGHDVRTWARHGFAATGMDLAATAMEVARERTTAAGLDATFRVGDFLRDEPAESFDWVFEHTLFCAIHPTERELYARALDRWLAPGGQLLAVHYMLEPEPTEDPPFPCSQEELMERFSSFLELEAGWVPRSYPNRTGLELMLRWKRRGGPALAGR